MDGDDASANNSESDDGTRGSLPRRVLPRSKEERFPSQRGGRRSAPAALSSEDNASSDVSDDDDDDDDDDDVDSEEERRDDVLGQLSIRVPRSGSLSIARPLSLLLEHEVLVRWMADHSMC
jgi:hypothetical protein